MTRTIAALLLLAGAAQAAPFHTAPGLDPEQSMTTACREYDRKLAECHNNRQVCDPAELRELQRRCAAPERQSKPLKPSLTQAPSGKPEPYSCTQLREAERKCSYVTQGRCYVQHEVDRLRKECIRDGGRG